MPGQFLNGADFNGQRVRNLGAPQAATDAAWTALYGPTVALTAAGTLTAGRLNTVDASTGAFTATLPTPAYVGQQISIEKIDTSTNAVTISGTVRGVTVNVAMPGIGVAGQSVALIAESLTSWRPFNDKPLAFLDARYAPLGSGGSGIPRTLLLARPRVGQWILPAMSGGNNASFAEAQLRLGSLYLPPGTYDAFIAAWNAGSAGAILRCAAYADGDSGPTGAPLREATADATTTVSYGVLTLATPLVIAEPGQMVWVGAAPQGGASTRPSTANVAYSGLPQIAAVSGQYVSDNVAFAAVIASVTGAAPSNPTVTYDRQFPRVGFRRSA